MILHDTKLLQQAEVQYFQAGWLSERYANVKPWRWKQYVFSKRSHLSASLHSAKTQKNNTLNTKHGEMDTRDEIPGVWTWNAHNDDNSLIYYNRWECNWHCIYR